MRRYHERPRRSELEAKRAELAALRATFRAIRRNTGGVRRHFLARIAALDREVELMTRMALEAKQQQRRELLAKRSASDTYNGRLHWQAKINAVERELAALQAARAADRRVP